MDLRVFFKHMESSPALHTYAEQKLGERLNKYSLNVIEAQVTFAVDGGLHCVSCHVTAGGGVTLTVDSEDASSMYAAIDLLTDKLDTCLRRIKEKRRSHKLGSPIDLRPLVEVSDNEGSSEEPIDAEAILSFEKVRASTSS